MPETIWQYGHPPEEDHQLEIRVALYADARDDCGEYVCDSCGWTSASWWAKCRRCGAAYPMQYAPQECEEEDE